jgi:hypothetical protein
MPSAMLIKNLENLTSFWCFVWRMKMVGFELLVCESDNFDVKQSFYPIMSFCRILVMKMHF